MKTTRIIAFVIIIASASSSILIINDCKLTKKRSNKLIDSIKIKGNVFFSLDEKSTFFNSQVKFYENDTNCYFSFLNKFNNTVYIYRYDNSNILKKITLPKSAGGILGYILKDSNKIDVLSNGKIYFIDILTNSSRAFLI